MTLRTAIKKGCASDLDKKLYYGLWEAAQRARANKEWGWARELIRRMRHWGTYENIS